MLLDLYHHPITPPLPELAGILRKEGTLYQMAIRGAGCEHFRDQAPSTCCQVLSHTGETPAGGNMADYRRYQLLKRL